MSRMWQMPLLSAFGSVFVRVARHVKACRHKNAGNKTAVAAADVSVWRCVVNAGSLLFSMSYRSSIVENEFHVADDS